MKPTATMRRHHHGGKATHNDILSIGPAYLKPDELIQTGIFLDLMSAVTGIPDLRKSPGEPGEVRLTPKFNRAVIFETNEVSWHGFPKICLPPGSNMSRKTLALYFYTRDRPLDEKAPPRSTVYVEEFLPDHLVEGHTQAVITESLRDYLNKDRIPLIVLAVESGEVLGAAQLKYREMDIYPQKEHWLGGVFVSREHRGRSIAANIIHGVVSKAKHLGVRMLYLQTERLDGGLYRRLGWEPIEAVNYRGLDVLVMGTVFDI